MKLSMANTFGPYPVVRRTDVGTAVFSRWKSTRTCGMRYRVSKTPSQQLGSYVSEGCRQRANRKSETRGESASSRRLSLWTYGPRVDPCLECLDERIVRQGWKRSSRPRIPARNDERIVAHVIEQIRQRAAAVFCFVLEHAALIASCKPFPRHRSGRPSSPCSASPVMWQFPHRGLDSTAAIGSNACGLATCA